MAVLVPARVPGMAWILSLESALLPSFGLSPPASGCLWTLDPYTVA